jgi:hypothetical protein
LSSGLFARQRARDFQITEPAGPVARATGNRKEGCDVADFRSGLAAAREQVVRSRPTPADRGRGPATLELADSLTGERQVKEKARECGGGEPQCTREGGTGPANQEETLVV